MYRVPSRRKTKKEITKPNLIPILDSVFIFIFFLLMSASFLNIYEISSNVPIVSDAEPPKTKKKPLALTLKINSRSITVYTGIPARVVSNIRKNADGKYDLEKLRNLMIQLKTKHKNEKTVVLEPVINVSYQDLVSIMDAVRILRKTDPAIYTKDKNGLDIKVNELFSNIVFGNIQT